MPGVDQFAQQIPQTRVVAVARLSDPSKAADLAAESLSSGLVAWGLDVDDVISAQYRQAGVPGSVLVYGGVEIQRWFGPAPDGAWQASFNELAQLIGLPGS